MWTNIFRIGGLHQVSWFQFLPSEVELSQLSDKSGKFELRDCIGARQVLASHLQLQKEGILSTWTNSFVGPWDPSQGLHNPDEKLKLWIFLPGRQSSVIESALPFLSKLRVVASGVWLAPGNSEEVSGALSQSLRNCIETALLGQSFLRYGDVFTKTNPLQVDGVLRKGKITVELVFSASEEYVYVHAVISAKHIRTLSISDMDILQKQMSHNSSYRLPVIVPPNGLRGWLTGCRPNDLVKQVYLSTGKYRGSNVVNMSQGIGCQIQGQGCFAEVKLGCRKSESSKDHNSRPMESPIQKFIHDCHASDHQKVFVYPIESVIVPMMQTMSARSSLKRFWLQNMAGSSFSGSSLFTHCGSEADFLEGHWAEIFGQPFRKEYNSSSNSNSSSISSVCTSSCDSDQRMMSTTGELEADADSLSCRQSSLSTNTQFEMDGPKLGSKRLRTGMLETYGKLAMGSVQDSYKSDFSSMDMSYTSVTGVENDLEWDDSGGFNISIQALLSEFGDFGGFFETERLDFGEPPGTAESHAPIHSSSECEVGTNPIGILDASEPTLLPIGYSSLETFNQPLSTAADDLLSKSEEIAGSSWISGSSGYTPSTGEFDHLIKAEALMTFAPEYGAVETRSSDFSSSIFRTPYCPKIHMVESSSSSTKNYRYGATPPFSDEKVNLINNSKTAKGKLDPKKCYTQVVSGRELKEERSFKIGEKHGINEDALPSFSTVTSASTSKSVQSKGSEATDHVEILSRTVLPTDIDCLLFQAYMRRVRHIHLSSDINLPINSSKVSNSNMLHLFSGDEATMTDTPGKYDMRKMETIPMRIAGDVDGILDGNPNASVGAWHSVGIPKIMKPINTSNVEAASTFPHPTFGDDAMLSYGQRQPLQELLNSIPTLVQQATAFVDVALDGVSNDGPFSWLALQEQWRRGFCCGPSAVHAGCGGTLAASHFLDIAGVELVDPFSAEVVASNTINLLQCEIKNALKTAFKTLDGPLSMSEWCKGRGTLVDVAVYSDGSFVDSTLSEYKDCSSIVSPSVGDFLSPAQSSGGSISTFRDKTEDSLQRRYGHGHDIEVDHHQSSRFSSVMAPHPAMLVGYQDDWLKTSTTCLQLWEKAPFEPYALPKPITYYVCCPEIDPLTSAAADFFLQLGTVYETCNLGSHLPQASATEMELDSAKWSSSGFVLLDCPQSMKIESTNASLVGSLSDYFLSLSNGWDLTSYLKSLSKAIRGLKLPFSSTIPREGNSGPCMVIYVVCPFPEPTAVLQTLLEASIALGTINISPDRERKSAMHNQVGKALSSSTSFDEASASNVLVLSGFSSPKLVLQVVTVDAIFRVSTPALNELHALKEIAFTVYNKARRIPKGSFNDFQLSTLSSRSVHLGLPQMALGEIDSSLRPGTWDNSWQSRTIALNGDQARNGEYFLLHDDLRYMFEPLFILSEPGSLEHAVATFETHKLSADDPIGSSTHNTDASSSSHADASEDGFSSCYQKTNPSLHCCYGWTEDWRWLVCIWTDARGELLDSHLFPFGGISSRQDTKGLQSVFMQVLQQGCQILQACSSPNASAVKPRDFVISRIGNFFDLEYLEWQKAIYAVGGSEMKRWPVQLRRQSTDGIGANNNGASLQPQDMSLIKDRTISSSSPLYGHTKPSGFMKSSIGQPPSRKQPILGRIEIDYSRGILQLVQSITFATISIDHSLQITVPSDSPTSGTQNGNFPSVRSLTSAQASYFLIPLSEFRFLSATPLQLPTCLTAESPPLAHLLHSRGSATPLLTGFVVSKSVPSIRSDDKMKMGEEWPAVLRISLVDYYGGASTIQDTKFLKRNSKQGAQQTSQAREEIQPRAVLESLAAELHALSWMTISPVYSDRRTALPFHCDMVLRLQRLLHFADTELSSQQDRHQV